MRNSNPRIQIITDASTLKNCTLKPRRKSLSEKVMRGGNHERKKKRSHLLRRKVPCQNRPNQECMVGNMLEEEDSQDLETLEHMSQLDITDQKINMDTIKSKLETMESVESTLKNMEVKLSQKDMVECHLNQECSEEAELASIQMH